MKRAVLYLIAIGYSCGIFYAGMKYAQYRGQRQGEEILGTYDLFEQEDLFSSLINKESNVNWGKPAVDSILAMYGKFTKNIQIEDYPLYINNVNATFEFGGDVYKDYHLYQTALHKFQYLYLNHLYEQLPDSPSKEQLIKVLSAVKTWEKTLMSLHNNNVLLGECAYRLYLVECSTITYDILDNIRLLLDWLYFVQKDNEGNEAGEYKLYQHDRWMMMEDYISHLKITEDRLKETEDRPTKIYYTPTFEDGTDSRDELTPEIGDMVIDQENKAWIELSEALDNFEKSIGVNPSHSSEWKEWKEVARYNSLHTVTTYVL